MRKGRVYIASASMLLAMPVFAQESSVNFSQVLLTIAILLGIVASVYVFSLSSKMGTGGISTALFLYGIGMLSVVISLLSVTWCSCCYMRPVWLYWVPFPRRPVPGGCC